MKLLNMSGYALYVWSAYGIAIAVLAVNVYLSIKARRKATLSSLKKK